MSSRSIMIGADLGAITEAYVPPRIYPSGTLTLELDFSENGRFIGLVTLIQPNGEKKTAQFKFAVGRPFLDFAPVVLGGVLIAAMLFLFWKHGGTRLKSAG